MREWTIALAATGLLAVTPAESAVSIIGQGFARQCYEAAEQQNRRRSAAQVCDRALDDEAMSSRDRAATFVNRGIIRMLTGDVDGAIGDYDAALKVQNRLGEAWVNKGIALLRRGNMDSAAIDALTTGLALKPSRPEVAYYSRAVAYELTGNVRGAYEDYKAAAEAKPGWEVPAEQLKRFSVQRRPSGQG